MRKQHGFSLIELLIVIAIITALAGTVTVSAKGILKNSRETAAFAHVQTRQEGENPVPLDSAPLCSALQDLSAFLPEQLASGTPPAVGRHPLLHRRFARHPPRQ